MSGLKRKNYAKITKIYYPFRKFNITVVQSAVPRDQWASSQLFAMSWYKSKKNALKTVERSNGLKRLNFFKKTYFTSFFQLTQSCRPTYWRSKNRNLTQGLTKFDQLLVRPRDKICFVFVILKTPLKINPCTALNVTYKAVNKI